VSGRASYQGPALPGNYRILGNLGADFDYPGGNVLISLSGPIAGPVLPDFGWYDFTGVISFEFLDPDPAADILVYLRQTVAPIVTGSNYNISARNQRGPADDTDWRTFALGNRFPLLPSHGTGPPFTPSFEFLLQCASSFTVHSETSWVINLAREAD